MGEFQPTRKRKLVGHLIGVPIKGDTLAVCIVLWQSSVYKNVVSLGITDLNATITDYPDNLVGLVSAIDTSAAMIRAGDWHLGPKATVSIPPGFSTRRVAGTVYCDDQELREAGQEDLSPFPS